MARFYFVLGLVLLVVAIAVLFVGISGMDNPVVAGILQRLHCQPNETVGWVLGPYTTGPDGGGQSVTFHCEDRENQQRDITLPAIVTIATPFVVLLLASIAAFIHGSHLMTRGLTEAMTSYSTQYPIQGGGQISTTFIDLQGGNLNNIPADKMEKVQKALEMFNFPMMAPSGNDDLTSKLQQLDEARSKGLISDIEYERIRRDILDSLAE